jgi:Flp pilus assembly protein TadG
MNRRERGAALVEFAFALPLLLVVLAGIVDFGFAFQRYEVITNAAREGARLATLPGYDSTSVESRVRSYVQQGLSLSPAGLTATMGASGSGSVTTTYPTVSVPVTGLPNVTVNTALVTVTYRHTFLLLGPMLGLINHSWSNNITLRATSQMRIES